MCILVVKAAAAGSDLSQRRSSGVALSSPPSSSASLAYETRSLTRSPACRARCVCDLPYLVGLRQRAFDPVSRSVVHMTPLPETLPADILPPDGSNDGETGSDAAARAAALAFLGEHASARGGEGGGWGGR